MAQERGYDAATHRNTLGQVLHIRLHRRQKRSQNTWPDPDLIEQYLQIYTSNNNTAYQDGSITSASQSQETDIFIPRFYLGF